VTALRRRADPDCRDGVGGSTCPRLLRQLERVEALIHRSQGLLDPRNEASRQGSRSSPQPKLARVMLQRALDAGVPAGWVTPMRSTAAARHYAAGWRPARCPTCWPSRPPSRCRRRRGRRRRPPGWPSTSRRACWLRVSAGQGTKGRRWYGVEPPAAQHGWRAAGVGALAAAPQPSHRGAGVLQVRRPRRHTLGRPGAHRRGSLAGGGGVPGRQGAVRPGPAPGPPLALLVPVGDPGHAGLRIPGGGRGHPARPPPTTFGAHPVDL
jgi:hypothetical protein